MKDKWSEMARNIGGYPMPSLTDVIPGTRFVDPPKEENQGWRFEASGWLETGKVGGIIYRGKNTQPVGEWTAIVYALADGICWNDVVNNPRKDNKMSRGLYSVFVVDAQNEEVVFDSYVVAQSYDGAKLRVLKSADLKKDIEEYDIIVLRLGDVRAKKEVQEVKIVSS